MFSRLFDRLMRASDSDSGVLESKSQILADLHLFVNGISPLDSSKLDIDQQELESEVNYRVYNQVESEVNIMSKNLRITTLTDLYPALPISFLKAKSAFALGLHAVECNSHQDAERLFFEAIYVLENSEPYAPNMSAVVSQLGTNCLSHYGDELLYNYKQRYAVEAFYACSINYQLRNRKREYLQLLEKMASVCKDQSDIKRATGYYRELLTKYLQEEKLNEVIILMSTT